jgi:hypothetical protein
VPARPVYAAMGRKRDEVFVLGEESLGEEPSREGLRHEEPAQGHNPFAARATAAPDAEDGLGKNGRSARRPLAALGLGIAAAALFALLALRGGDRRPAETPSALRDGAAVVEAPLGARPQLGPHRSPIAPAPRRKRRHVEPKLRPTRSPRRPGGGREREPTSEQAPPAPPLDTAAPAAALVPLPEPPTSPAPPSRPPASGDGSGRGPEFSFER